MRTALTHAIPAKDETVMMDNTPNNAENADTPDFMQTNGEIIDAPDAHEVKVISQAPEQNPYKKWIYLAKALDAWRPFPRMFIMTYMVIVYNVVEWFMMLPAPTLEQSGLISIVVGAGAAWFSIYVNSGGKTPTE